MKIQAIVVLATLLVTLNLVSESNCLGGTVPNGKRQMQGKVGATQRKRGSVLR